MTTAEILTAAETCTRKAFWSRKWERNRIPSTEMVRRAVVAGLSTTDRDDYGEFAGETVMALCSDRGLDTVADRITWNMYESAVNHAAVADIVTTAIRRPGASPWAPLPPKPSWESSAYVDTAGTRLRRFLPVSSWNPERQEHEIRSWYGIGEVCHLNLPMQMVVAVIGPMNNGKRRGHWSKALLHPQRSSLRFRKRERGSVEGFKDTWLPMMREDNDTIDRERWLQCMLEDDVLKDSLMVVEIPVPGEAEVQAIRDMAKRKLEALDMRRNVPDRQLSSCDGPLSPCPFRECCWGADQGAPEESAFRRV